MKLRHPLLIKIVGLMVAVIVRLWIGTLRLRTRSLGGEVFPGRPGFCGQYLYAFWHEDMLVPAHWFSNYDFAVLISKHADGELIARACRHLGIGVVRGSTKGRDGVAAVRELVRVAARGPHLVLTPDGPRGPRRVVQPGLIYVAARTGLPVVAAGFAYSRCRRMRSWDRFVLPAPFASAWIVCAEPIHVPADLGRNGLEEYRRRVQEAMDRACAAAERLAAGGRLDTPADAARAA
jgi:lysophospholipid acyltransferase (LPLAT)-like uncharacterized protein